VAVCPSPSHPVATVGPVQPAVVTRRTVVDLDFEPDLVTVRHAIDGTVVGDRAGRELRWATVTPVGIGSLHLRRSDARRVEVTAFGAGADWLVEQTPRLLGAADDVEELRRDLLPPQLARRPVPRIGRTDRVVESMVPAVLGQKVQATLANRSLRLLAARFGDAAPGPGELRATPSAARLADLAVHDLHRCGVERKRGDTIRRAARLAFRLEEAAGLGPEVLEARLRAVPGIGPWTSALVRLGATGDPDAVEVGDFHLPNTVCWALAGEERGDDRRMLELLEPFRGHRGRVVRMISALGLRAPRRGPRLEPLPVDRYDGPDRDAVWFRDRGPGGGGWRDRPLDAAARSRSR